MSDEIKYIEINIDGEIKKYANFEFFSGDNNGEFCNHTFSFATNTELDSPLKIKQALRDMVVLIDMMYAQPPEFSDKKIKLKVIG